MNWNEIAILYRNSWMGRRLYRGFRAAGLPIEWVNRDKDSRHFNPTEQSIKLITLHSSKGLEFQAVMIPGLGYLPDQQADLLDETRLLYVGITRAMTLLLLTGDRSSIFVQQVEAALQKVG